MGRSTKPPRSPQKPPDTTLHGTPLTAARATWFAAVLLIIRLWALGSYELFSRPPPSCSETICNNMEFSAGDVEILRELDLPAIVRHELWYGVATSSSVAFFVIAGFIFWRRSSDWMALLLSFSLIYLTGVGFTFTADALRRTHPELNPVLFIMDHLGFAAAIVLYLTFPDGRRAGKWFWWISGALFVIVFAIPLSIASPSSFLASLGRPTGPDVPPIAALLWVSLIMILVGVGLYSQIYRYLHMSTDVQRQQLKWVLFGFVALNVTIPIWGYIGFAYPPSQPSPTRVGLLLFSMPLNVTLTTLLPLTVAFSILRYRLFDIDRIINRTLVYGTLTGVLVIVYFIGVVVLQNVFALVGGQRSPLAVVLSTLAIAALFNPLRRWLQAFIDRRFFRRKYDTELVLAKFSSMTRDELEMDALSDEFLSVVEETLHPADLSLWLREPGRPVT